MELSVIIPVYNAGCFIEKAVNSALQFDIVKEILLIEDGSDDNSLKICVSLEKEHSRVKLFQTLIRKTMELVQVVILDWRMQHVLI